MQLFRMCNNEIYSKIFMSSLPLSTQQTLLHKEPAVRSKFLMLAGELLLSQILAIAINVFKFENIFEIASRES